MTSPASAAAPRSEFDALALDKLVRVLGSATGARVFDETLKRAGLTGLGTADELYRFAGVLSKRAGFEGAVGGLLAVSAVMKGSTGGG